MYEFKGNWNNLKFFHTFFSYLVHWIIWNVYSQPTTTLESFIFISTFQLLKKVQIWRRSFDVPPPPLEESSEFYKIIVDDPRYANEPSKDEFPMFESLKLTIARTLPYWNDVIVPQIKEGKRILIAAHGNSLRGIVKHLDSKTSWKYVINHKIWLLLFPL